MEWDEGKQIFEQIRASKNSDETLSELVDEMVISAVKYSRIRTNWRLSSFEEKREMDCGRTKNHNSFIDTCNSLGKYMSKIGLDISWRERMGHDRKEIGDLACYIHAILGIEAR